MAVCVSIDQDGYLYQTAGQYYPACQDFVLTSVAHLDRLTYWADLAMELEPGTAAFALMVGAMITSVGVVLGARMVYDNLRTLTKEA